MNVRAIGFGSIREGASIMACFLVGFIGICVLWGTGGSEARAQSSGVVYDAYCWKVRICSGASAQGICQPLGFFCGAGSCSPGAAPSNGCSWACVDSCEESCFFGSQEETGTDCGPKCKWLSYNQCACACQDLGVGTVEGGAYSTCW